jgi:hypothetical protein
MSSLQAQGQAAVTAAVVMTRIMEFGEEKSIFRQDGNRQRARV